MTYNFIKMQGTGNDFVMIDGRNRTITDHSGLAQKLCDRHFGIGADGLILILPAEDENNDFRMRIFNADGSEAEMCGNGIRCVTHFLRLQKMSSEKIFSIETKAGIIKPEIIDYNEKQSQVKVNMGSPAFVPEEIPVNIEMNTESVFNFKLITQAEEFIINCVSMGNPHSIIFRKSLEDIQLTSWGKKIENHPLFPEKTNVEFVKIINEREIELKVWERGSGITLACGTGACASVVAGIKQGHLNQAEDISVHLPGGDLTVNWSGKDVYMTGPATTVFKGEIGVIEEEI
ncbi:MAG: diaminopimelate epimerase [Halanaerobiaceae bacterium]